MVNAVKHRNITFHNKVKEVNSRLDGLKNKWNADNRISGSFEIPENIISLEGVEYLLKLNTFNEVPTVLTYVAPYLMEYRVLAKTSEYSEAKYNEYVEKGTELIERLLALYDSLGIDLAKITISDESLFLASKWYIRALANEIGKSKEYDV